MEITYCTYVVVYVIPMLCAVNVNTSPIIRIEEIPLRSRVCFRYLRIDIAAKEIDSNKRNKLSHNLRI